MLLWKRGPPLEESQMPFASLLYLKQSWSILKKKKKTKQINIDPGTDIGSSRQATGGGLDTC